MRPTHEVKGVSSRFNLVVGFWYNCRAFLYRERSFVTVRFPKKRIVRGELFP